jgi:hypothetical protein
VAGLLAAVALLGLAHVALPALRRVRDLLPDRLNPLQSLWLLHALAVAVVAVSVWSFALGFNGGATGKYLFPAFPSLALLLAAGWLAWFRKWPAWQGRVAVALLSLELIASVYALFGLLLPAYGPPRRPLPFELSQAVPLEADLGGAARVLGYRLATGRVIAGQNLELTVYWLPAATTTVPHTVFVHLYSQEYGSIAQQDIYPGGGTYPTIVWVPGRPFADTYRLPVPPGSPAVVGGRILLGLYDEHRQARLPVTGANAGPPGTNWVEFGSVEVIP